MSLCAERQAFSTRIWTSHISSDRLISWRPCRNFVSDNNDDGADSSPDLDGDDGSNVVEVVVLAGAVSTRDDR